jgi:hypothetical protein
MISKAIQQARSLSGRARMYFLSGKLRACQVPRIVVSDRMQPSIWLRDLVSLGDLRGLDVRESVALKFHQAFACDVPQLLDLNGNSYRYLRGLGQAFEELVHVTTQVRGLEIAAISGLQTCLTSEIQFRTIDEYYRHPHCQAQELRHRFTFEQCVARMFEDGLQHQFLVPAWSAFNNDGEARVYWLNSNHAHLLAVAQARARAKSRTHEIRARVDVQYIRSDVLEELLAMAAMVMVDSQHAELRGLYDVLREVDFPVLVLRGLNPFSRTRGVQTAPDRDVLIFPRTSASASGCAELLLRENRGADFGAFLNRLLKSQPAQFAGEVIFRGAA